MRPSPFHRFRLPLVLALVAGTSGAALLRPAAAGAQEGAYQVVVHAASDVQSVSSDDLARIFLKKSVTWPGGGAAMPVDRSEDAPVRHAFSKAVLGREMDSLRRYWQQAIFTGRAVPPPQKASDAEVLAYVAANPGAVGYVSAGASLPGGVRVLKVTD